MLRVSSAVGQVKGNDEMSFSKLGQHSSADYDHLIMTSRYTVTWPAAFSFFPAGFMLIGNFLFAKDKG